MINRKNIITVCSYKVFAINNNMTKWSENSSEIDSGRHYDVMIHNVLFPDRLQKSLDLLNVNSHDMLDKYRNL